MSIIERIGTVLLCLVEIAAVCSPVYLLVIGLDKLTAKLGIAFMDWSVYQMDRLKEYYDARK